MKERMKYSTDHNNLGLNTTLERPVNRVILGKYRQFSITNFIDSKRKYRQGTWHTDLLIVSTTYFSSVWGSEKFFEGGILGSIRRECIKSSLNSRPFWKRNTRNLIVFILKIHWCLRKKYTMHWAHSVGNRIPYTLS